MELKKLHMGTMSYGADSMDEVAHQLALSFGLSSEQGDMFFFYLRLSSSLTQVSKPQRVKHQPQLAFKSQQEVVEICPPG